jgi:hypothetical protein
MRKLIYVKIIVIITTIITTIMVFMIIKATIAIIITVLTAIIIIIIVIIIVIITAIVMAIVRLAHYLLYFRYSLIFYIALVYFGLWLLLKICYFFLFSNNFLNVKYKLQNNKRYQFMLAILNLCLYIFNKLSFAYLLYDFRLNI